MAYTTIDDPSAYFQTATYTGDGAGSLAITNTGNSDLQPDWLWIKKRNGAVNHLLHDSVRGVTNLLVSNTTAGDDSNSNIVLGFDSDGFRVGANSASNGSGDTFVAWQWKAGGSTSSNTAGSLDSTVSVNTTAGFSIVTWTGNGSAETIGHGLGSIPKMVIVKRRNSAEHWQVYHVSLGGTKYLQLSTNEVEASASSRWANSSPTSNVFYVGGHASTNADGDTYVAYCFAEKQGYSKFKTYVGNGNADGPFVYTGFKPAIVFCKKSSASGDWELYDNKRNGFNGGNVRVIPNANDAETGTGRLSLLSNGFKITTSSGNLNTNNATYIYFAWAENPFVTSKGVPATAR